LATLVACAALGAVLSAPLAPRAWAAGGSGSAALSTAYNPVVAGAYGDWTINYTAAEGFDFPGGGVLEIWIPAGWTPPQLSNPLAHGYVTFSNAAYIDSAVTIGPRIRLRLGTPGNKFDVGSVVGVHYGLGGPAQSARADVVAPQTPPLLVLSQPSPLSGHVLTPLAGGSPSVAIVPDTVASVRIVDGANVEVNGFSRTADQDSALFLRGYDQYGNLARPVAGAWSVSGGIGTLADTTASGKRFIATTAGTGKVYADSGAWRDSTGVVTVTHGAYASLALTSPSAATAGTPFAATVEARDADGNRVTGGPGSAAPIRAVAYADSLGGTPADPSFVDPDVTLAAGFWSGAWTARRSGAFFLAARDTATGRESSPRRRLVVAPGTPDRLVASPDTLRLTAGVPDTVTVTALDAFGNRAPFASDEELTLWTDRPEGRFESLAGAPIFTLTIPAGRDSAEARFVDTEATVATGRIRVIDANGAAPVLAMASAPVVTVPNAPAGAVALAAAPGSLIADGVDSARVTSAVVRDAFGNAVAAGERFTVTGAGVAVVTDEDAGATGAQWTAAADGTLAGWVRAGTAAGSGSVDLVSERGSASGSVAIALSPGAPAGAIALTADPDSVAADGLATRAVTAAGLVDAFGNPVLDGEAYTVATTLGSIVTADADPGTPGVQVPASGGAIAFTLLGGTALGTANVSAASVRGSASGAVDVRLVPGAVSADSSSAVATSPVPVGAPGSVVTVTLRDRAGHALAGVSRDSLSVAGASGVPVATSPLAASTDATGAIDYSATATLAGASTLSIAARGVTLAAAPVVQFVHGALDTLVVTGPAGPLTAGVPDSLVVEARDPFGNPMPDRTDTVHATVTGGAASGVPATLSLTAGAAVIPFTPTGASPLTIQVADDSSHAASHGPVAVRAGAPWRIALDPVATDTLRAGGSVPVRARLFDAFDNAADGDTVLASVVAGGGGVAPGSAVTDGSGAADFVLSAGTAPGTVTLRLEAKGSAAPDPVRADSVTVTVVPSTVASVEIAAGGAASAGDFLDFTLTLRDAFGNVATGATPTLNLDTSASLPDSVTWSPGPGASGALVDGGPSGDTATYAFAAADAGVAAVRVRFTRAETVRVAVSGAGPAAQSGDILVTPAAASSLAILSGQGQTAVVDREVASPLRVEARDAFGNPVPGAPVTFRIVAGGGSLDAVRGGAADSIALTGGAGVAACEVVRVGTTAGISNNGVRALLPFPGDSVLFLASASPDTAVSIALAPGGFGLTARDSMVVTATARDAFGNAAPGTPVTFYLGSPPAGSLAGLGSTTGTGTTQAGNTDASGQVSVLYRAPTTAPASDVIYARGTSIAPVSVAATVSPSGIASLVVLPDAAAWTAGVPARVVVRALDAAGNVASGDTATVVLGATDAASFNPAFGALSGGELVLFATATLADTLRVTAATAAGSLSAASGPVAVTPAAPAGAIPIAAGRTVLTADGRSSTAVTVGPVRDAYGNTTPAGTQLTVSADSLLAPDASPAPGLQIATGSDDLARAVLVAPITPGPDRVRARSVSGTALDSLDVLYLPPPTLARAGPLAPSITAPGQIAAFQVDVANTAASGAVSIGAASVFAFGAGPSAFAASPASPLAIPAGETRTLALPATAVSAALAPGTYAPSLRLAGTDATGDPFDFYLPLAGEQVHVAGIRVVAVSAAPDPVPLGYPDLALTFRVDNLAATPATIDGAALTPASFLVGSVSPAIPAVLPASGSTTLTLRAAVPSSGIPPGTTVSADLAVSATFGPVAVSSATPSPVQFQVISGATLFAQAAGTAPGRYLRARTFAPAARVANGGAASVTLNLGATKLLLTRGAVRLESALSANAAVTGGGAADLAFDSLAVPAGAPLGRYAASLALSGTESGQAFADTIPLAPDSVDVLEPALLSVLGALAPDTVSAGQTRSLQLTLANGGDVPFALDPATRLVLGAPVSAALVPAGAGTVPAGGSLALTFTAAPLGSPLAPGTAAAVLEARGLEDGRARAEALDAGALAAEPPAALAYVAGSTAPDTVRAGQTVAVTAVITNGGGSAFLVDPSSTRLLVTDGVESAAATASGAPFTLAPSASATLAFPAVSFPAALASQPYPVRLTVAGSEWGQPESVAVVSPPGEIDVVEPVPAVQVRGLSGGAPVQVAAEAGPVALWTLELQPLLPPGGSASAHVNSLALTVLADGAPAASPSAALLDVTLRDSQGALLAQAAPGASNPVTLVLAAPFPLSGAPATLSVEVTVRPGAGARSVAVRLAAAGDLAVTDDLTQAAVPVTGAGGLAFQPITSPAVTIFERAHGYPNPFRAGREDVRLSYRLLADASVRVNIYTLLGDLVREISLAAGTPGGARGLNEVPWDGRNGRGETVRPGIYVARIEGGGVSERIKVGVLR
jgi:hypothetical protein